MSKRGGDHVTYPGSTRPPCTSAVVDMETSDPGRFRFRTHVNEDFFIYTPGFVPLMKAACAPNFAHYGARPKG